MKFVLIVLGTSQNHNSSLSTTHSAHNLGCNFHNILPFPTRFRPNLAIIISDSFAVFALTLIPPQLASLPPPSFAPDLITVILYCKLSKYQITCL